MSEQANIDWKMIRGKAGSYPQEAFQFVREGLAHTARIVHGEGAENPVPGGPERHVSGSQLCLGLRDFAIKQYGMLARTVLAHWGIHRTDDFGRIVFAMIDGGIMRKSDQDSIEHFQGVFDFDEAFAVGEIA